MRRFSVLLLWNVALAGLSSAASAQPQSLPGLSAEVRVTRDSAGINHILAHRESDAYFMQGWLHARDRLFQMDQLRRTGSGTLAELLGAAALPGDVQIRTLGLRRAAERSLAALLPDTRAALDAYARGVNAYVGSHPLPPEYAVLELTRIPPWTPLDTVTIGKLVAAELSLDLDIDPTVALNAYVQAGGTLGFNGQALFFQDLDRAAPFDPAATVPDAMSTRVVRKQTARPALAGAGGAGLSKTVETLARNWRADLAKVPALAGLLDRRHRAGSNIWAVSGRLTESGHPLIANDPHLGLTTPAFWYPIGLDVPGQMSVAGDGIPGTPAVLHGYNAQVAWGSTTTGFDVTDTYQEQLVPDANSPSGLSTLYQGNLEPVVAIPEVFRANRPGDGVPDDVEVVPPGGAVPAATLVVPRRNQGPIVTYDPATGAALSLQWTGFSATRELDAVLMFDHAATLDDFVAALQYWDTGSQNWMVADAAGSIGYFSSGEVPVREDLQAGFVSGLPPRFIRNGQGGNEWLPVSHPQPHQALGYEVLPFAELPQIVNPPAGFVVNANNDPAGVTLDNNPLGTLRPGGGIYYLAWTFDDATGLRPGEITARLRSLLAHGERVGFGDMQSIQADVVLRDAGFFVPFIVSAFDRARQAGANPALAARAAAPGVAEAVGRLRHWDHTSPTGLLEGWDAGKPAGIRPGSDSVRASVAATLYTVWRGRFVANTIDKVIGGAGLPVPDDAHTASALRHLLENFATLGGRGESGVDFFPMPGVATPEDRRDIVILSSLSDALTMLAGDTFKPAFGNSTNQNDYRWGKLHRIVFASSLGAPFSIPPAGGAFPAPLPGLAGIPTDGGAETVDVAGFPLRAAKPDDFMFGEGPSHRFVADMAPGSIHAADALPGGTGGAPGNPLYMQLLPRWLENESVDLHLGPGEPAEAKGAVEIYRP